MGQFTNKRHNPKINKNHNRQKMFRFGISFGRNDLNLEGHLQMGYNSKTVKNHKPVENEINALISDDSKPVSLQSDWSAVCGEYCLFYLYQRSRGHSLNKIVHVFNNTLINVAMVSQLVKNHFKVTAPCRNKHYLITIYLLFLKTILFLFFMLFISYFKSRHGV